MPYAAFVPLLHVQSVPKQHSQNSFLTEDSQYDIHDACGVKHEACWVHAGRLYSDPYKLRMPDDQMVLLIKCETNVEYIDMASGNLLASAYLCGRQHSTQQVLTAVLLLA